MQQKAHTSPLSPTTFSSSSSSCVGAAHTCTGTCSHGPYGGYRTGLRIKNGCKCKSTHTYSCNSVPDPLHMFLTMPQCYMRANKCCVTPAFLGVPKQRGTKSELDASPLASRGPKRGRKCYVTPAFSGVPTQRRTKSELAASPLPSRGPKRGRKCYGTPAFSGVPKQRGTKSELAASPLPSRGPKRGRKCYGTPAFSGVPKQRGTKSEVKTYTTGNNNALSVSKYGSLVRPNAQIVTLRAHCAKCAPFVGGLGVGFEAGFGKKFYCLRQSTSKRGEERPFSSCRGNKTA